MRESRSIYSTHQFHLLYIVTLYRTYPIRIIIIIPHEKDDLPNLLKSLKDSSRFSPSFVMIIQKDFKVRNRPSTVQYLDNLSTPNNSPSSLKSTSPALLSSYPDNVKAPARDLRHFVFSLFQLSFVHLLDIQTPAEVLTSQEGEEEEGGEEGEEGKKDREREREREGCSISTILKWNLT